MPNQPRDDNRAHTVRVPDELWAKARERAAEKGETVSEAVRKFLERYTRGPGSNQTRTEIQER